MSLSNCSKEPSLTIGVTHQSIASHQLSGSVSDGKVSTNQLCYIKYMRVIILLTVVVVVLQDGKGY